MVLWGFLHPRHVSVWTVARIHKKCTKTLVEVARHQRECVKALSIMRIITYHCISLLLFPKLEWPWTSDSPQFVPSGSALKPEILEMLCEVRWSCLSDWGGCRWLPGAQYRRCWSELRQRSWCRLWSYAVGVLPLLIFGVLSFRKKIYLLSFTQTPGDSQLCWGRTWHHSWQPRRWCWAAGRPLMQPKSVSAIGKSSPTSGFSIAMLREVGSTLRRIRFSTTIKCRRSGVPK